MVASNTTVKGIKLRLPPVLPSARAITLGVAVTLFLLLCVLPIIYMLGVSFVGRDGSFNVGNYRQLLIDARQRELLLTSTLLGAGTALLSTIIGAPLGLLLARTRLPLKRMLRITLVIPLVVPPYVSALAWILMTGSTGIIARWFGSDLLSAWTYSLTGAVLVLGTSFYPLSMLATEAAARRVDGRLEEAGLLIASPGRVLWRVTLPLIGPTVAAAALIIFVLALAEFGVPGLLRVRVFTTEVFTAFSALYDFGAATALAVPLLAVALVVGIIAKLITGERMLATRRNLYPGLVLRLGRWRAVVLGFFTIILAASVILPLSALAIEAGQLERIIFALGTSGDAIFNSLYLSTIGATLTCALAVLLGYGRARSGARLRGLVDLLLIVIFAMPSTVVGVGLIGLWNRPGLVGAIYTSQTIIVVGYLARFVPVAALMLAASVRQIPVSVEEAAEVAGASWWRTLTRIVLPQMRTGLAAAWVVSFIFCFGELGATLLVAPPGESTLPVRVYTIIANTPPAEVAALALLQVGIILIPLSLLGFFSRGERGER
ncbi:MAG: iron ABC transporter permease [Acidobacteriota bacterium]|nr:iron ABC transporter permease [Acidobacteriota bacterium]